MKFSTNPPNKKESGIKVSYTDVNVIHYLSDALNSIFTSIPSNRSIACVCIGTDRSTGDALGPLVGTQLEQASIPLLSTYGTIDEPVHALNLSETLERIFGHLHNPFIIGIDACLGQVSSVGSIQIGYGPVKPGAGVNKDLPPVGDIHITGTVNVGGFMEYFVLQNTRLSLVMKMATIISESMKRSLIHHRTQSISLID